MTTDVAHIPSPVFVDGAMEQVFGLLHEIEKRVHNGTLNPLSVRLTLNEILDRGKLRCTAQLSGCELLRRRYKLTHRETELLGLLAEGLSNQEIAGRLFVTEQTVKFHLSNIYRKLRVNNRTHAVRLWLDGLRNAG